MPTSSLSTLLRKPLFWIAAIAFLFGVPLARAMLRPPPAPPPRLGRLPDFRLTDEKGAPFSRHDLAGKVWVADFIFTRCAGSCPLLSAKMEAIQHRTRQLGPDFHLVSFSVDPEHDTPADLADYARRFHANPRGWHFLTGRLDAMQEAVVKGFKIAMEKDKVPGGFFAIVHGEHFVLVDRRGEIRGYYPSDAEGVDRLVADVSLLVNQPDR